MEACGEYGGERVEAYAVTTLSPSSSSHSHGQVGAAQQVVAPLQSTTPPASVHRVSEDLILHFVVTAQSVSALHEPSQSSDVPTVQVPGVVVVSQVPNSVGIRHTTKPGLPHVERAAQRVTFPLQLVGICFWAANVLTACATQLTYCP